MCHFVERLAEIQKNSVNLLSLVQSAGQVMNCCYELRLTSPSLSEAMLLVTKDVMTVKVSYELLKDQHARMHRQTTRNQNAQAISSILKVKICYKMF